MRDSKTINVRVYHFPVLENKTVLSQVQEESDLMTLLTREMNCISILAISHSYLGSLFSILCMVYSFLRRNN